MKKHGKKYIEVAPSKTVVDPEYQREIDEARAQAMAKNFDPDLVGVVVLSKRDDGSLVRIDGQHRFAAAIYAGYGDRLFLSEVHSGLTVEEEARLFLRLNGGRSAVRAYDKFRARVTAQEESAVAITAIARKRGLSIQKNKYKNAITAVDALDSVYRAGNLDATLHALKAWADGDAEAFHRVMLRGVSAFLRMFPQASPSDLAEKLAQHSPNRVISKIERTKEGFGYAFDISACVVLREIYNAKRRAASVLPAVDVQTKIPSESPAKRAKQ